jgi:ComF family protein
MNSVSEVYSTLLDYLLPELCPLCSAPSIEGYCDDCRNEFSIVLDPCPTCGLARPVERCPMKDTIWPIERVLAPFTYSQPVISQIHALKFASGRNLGRALGLILAKYLRSDFDIEVDALIPIPLHKRRFRDRGYNQALEIARPVAASLRLPLRIAGVRRIVATKPLAELDAASRRRNVAGAFSITRNVNGLRIAIVDDVITTGSTANAVAGELLQAGAARVEAWAVARAL